MPSVAAEGRGSLLDERPHALALVAAPEQLDEELLLAADACRSRRFDSTPDRFLRSRDGLPRAASEQPRVLDCRLEDLVRGQDPFHQPEHLRLARLDLPAGVGEIPGDADA